MLTCIPRGSLRQVAAQFSPVQGHQEELIHNNVTINVFCTFNHFYNKIKSHTIETIVFNFVELKIKIFTKKS